MKLTNAERLIISMLADLHEKLGIDPENAKFINSAIHSDQAWAIPWKLTGLFGDQAERAPDEVYEVLNFLDMWAILMWKTQPAGRAQAWPDAGQCMGAADCESIRRQRNRP